MSEDLIEVGVFTAPHGIRGAVKLHSLTDFPEIRFAPGKRIYIDEGTELVIQESRLQKNTYVLKIEGITDRNAAELLRDKSIYVFQTDKIELPEDTYWTEDIIGCSVFVDDGQEIGTITEVIYGKANDSYVISDAQNSKKVIVPAIKEAICDIDMKAKKITIKQDYCCEY